MVVLDAVGADVDEYVAAEVDHHPDHPGIRHDGDDERRRCRSTAVANESSDTNRTTNAGGPHPRRRSHARSSGRPVCDEARVRVGSAEGSNTPNGPSEVSPSSTTTRGESTRDDAYVGVVCLCSVCLCVVARVCPSVVTCGRVSVGCERSVRGASLKGARSSWATGNSGRQRGNDERGGERAMQVHRRSVTVTRTTPLSLLSSSSFVRRRLLVGRCGRPPPPLLLAPFAGGSAASSAAAGSAT